MKSALIAFCMVLASSFATVTILATCGDHFTPASPSESNLTLWGTQCNGSFGKTHSWDIYWANYNIQGYEVTEPATCFNGGAQRCYPCFLTPVWNDPKKKCVERGNPHSVFGQ